MANIVEIDLDNNVIIEVPQGQKQTLAEVVALTYGWKEKIPNVEQKEHIGSEEYINKLESNLTENQMLMFKAEITDESSEDFGKFKLQYIDETPIDNPVSKVQFGLNYLQKIAGDVARNAVKEHQLKKLREQLQQAEQQLSAGLESSFENLIIK